MVLKNSLLFGLGLWIIGAQAHAQVLESGIDTMVPPVELQIRNFQETDFQSYPWLLEFENIIVVNKANEGSDKQTIRLYVNGVLRTAARTSTGRETYEKGCAPGQDPKLNHCSVRPYWSTTPVGYFDVDKLDENYFSTLWKTWMPYAVFFEPGIATHQAPAGTEGKLGHRASGGCVRLHPTFAPIIFRAVQSAGTGLIPKVNKDGSLARTAQGDVIRWQGYRTLVIVQNVIVP